MNEEVKRDVLAILNGVIEVLKVREEKDILEIKDLSDRIIHSASIFQDEDTVSVAVVVYSIYKIIDRHNVEESKIYTLISSQIKKAKEFLEKDDFNQYRATIKNLLKNISEIDNKLKIYIMAVIEKAKIKKGSKIYEHGISIARAAEILGISQWDLMSYVGKTETIEEAPKVTSLKGRLNFTRKLFGI